MDRKDNKNVEWIHSSMLAFIMYSNFRLLKKRISVLVLWINEINLYKATNQSK